MTGVFTVERHICGRWVSAQCETITQAPVDAHVIDKGIPTTGLMAQVLVAKYAIKRAATLRVSRGPRDVHHRRLYEYRVFRTDFVGGVAARQASALAAFCAPDALGNQACAERNSYVGRSAADPGRAFRLLAPTEN